MGSKFKIKTKCQNGNDGEEYQPVSPITQYITSENLPLAIILVLEFEIPIDGINSTSEVFQKIAQSNPRFSSVVVVDEKGEKHWKRVEVNIDDHLYFPTFPTNMTLKEYDNVFDEYLSKLSIDPFSQDIPLWQIHIIKYPTSNSAGQIILKLDHAIGDGYTITGLILSCLQRVDNPSLPPTFPTFRQTSNPKITSSIRSNLSAMYNACREFGWGLWNNIIADDITPIRSGNEALKPIKISTITFSLDKVKEIKTKLEVTVNDVLTAIILLGTRSYMQEIGNEYGASKSTLIEVVNTRPVNAYASIEEMQKSNGKAEWGNKVLLLQIPIPKITDETTNDPLNFVFMTRNLIQRQRNPVFLSLVAHTNEIIRRIFGIKAGSKYTHSLFKNHSVLVTNMIGPSQKLGIADHPIKDVYFMLTGAPLSILVTILSYMKTLRIAIGVEGGFINVEKYCSCIHNAYEDIYKAAMEKSSTPDCYHPNSL